MIIKKENTQSRIFKGVNFDILAVGEKSMLTKMNYKEGDNVPKHTHPNEQNGYVISGEYLIEFGQSKEIIKPIGTIGILKIKGRVLITLPYYYSSRTLRSFTRFPSL